MGQPFSTAVSEPLKVWPHKMDVDFRNPPTMDPMLGFPNGRKERGTIMNKTNLLSPAMNDLA